MKRLKIFIGTTLTAIVCISAAAFPVAAESSYVRGDADGDKTVTIRDVTEIQRKLVNIPTPRFNQKAADVDDNGLDITDATKIQRYLAGFDDPHNIGEIVRFDEYELPFIPN